MKRSKQILLWLFSSFVLAGVIESYFPEGSENARGISVAHTFVISILVFAWCKAHAQENDVTLRGGYRLFAAVIPPIGVPSYFFKYYGFKAGVLKVLKSIGVLVILASGYLVPYIGLSYVSV